MNLLIKKNITLEDIARSDSDCIYYSANTCWWTHADEDLQKPESGGIPRDSANSVLLMADDVKLFVRLAIANEHRYGTFKLQTFMASHHKNSFVPRGDQHAASVSWSDYERAYGDMLDSQIVRDIDLVGDIEFIKRWCNL